jgi:RNA polymerase sigma-70 factor (ECF subfamily)
MAAMTDLEPPTDAALVAQYRSGDERAATELVRRHAPSLTRYLHGAGAPPGDVDDLVQESLFRAFRRLDTWRGDASFRSWLLTIGGNLMRDDWRRRKGRQMLSIEETDVPDSADPHEEATASEAEARLLAGLARLPRLQREVFLLRAQQGQEYADIAVALGTTPGAARVHYHHAVRRLKELVQ